jgi:sugar O-acyltransferase (sialic acid O-acetyltransferase NeuD family)
MKERLLLIGASGHGKVVAEIALKMQRWKMIAFLDDDKSIEECMGCKVVGCTADAYSHIPGSDLFVAVGNNETRKKLQQSLEQAGASIPTLIHPQAVIGSETKLGAGTVIMAGAVINCSTVIGKGCIVNTGATIDHDNRIEDFVHISPGVHLAGTVKIGSATWLGIGSIVINNISVAEGCRIGAGTVVIRDITEPGTYVGNPQRRIR